MDRSASKKPHKVKVKKHDWRDTCVGCSKTLSVNEESVDIRIGTILPKEHNKKLSKERFSPCKNWGRMCLSCFSRALELPEVV